jgi:aspartyl-tRNA(Asn)/glutamyl-tRNA(Gln) amidotransferase subunit C
MSLDKATVARIATLARIKIPDSDLEHLAGELSQILGWIEQLGEVDTTGVEPMTHGVAWTSVFVDDTVGDELPRESALANAPKHDGERYLVPAVLE